MVNTQIRNATDSWLLHTVGPIIPPADACFNDRYINLVVMMIIWRHVNRFKANCTISDSDGDSLSSYEFVVDFHHFKSRIKTMNDERGLRELTLLSTKHLKATRVRNRK